MIVGMPDSDTGIRMIYLRVTTVVTAIAMETNER